MKKSGEANSSLSDNRHSCDPSCEAECSKQSQHSCDPSCEAECSKKSQHSCNPSCEADESHALHQQQCGSQCDKLSNKEWPPMKLSKPVAELPMQENEEYDFDESFRVPKNVDLENIRFKILDDGFSITYDHEDDKNGPDMHFSLLQKMHYERRYGKHVHDAAMEIVGGWMHVKGHFKALKDEKKD